ncbi:MAG: hypothetical protein AAGA50_09370 [Pseudomonadota bacterium]
MSFADFPDYKPLDLKSLIDGTEAGFQSYVSEFEETLFAISVSEYSGKPDSHVVQSAYADAADDNKPGSALITRDGRTLGIIYADGQANFHHEFREQVQNLRASSWEDMATKAVDLFDADIELSPAAQRVSVTV